MSIPFFSLLLSMKYPYESTEEIGQVINFYSFTYSLMTCPGLGISKYRDYCLDTRDGSNKYDGYHSGQNR